VDDSRRARPVSRIDRAVGWFPRHALARCAGQHWPVSQWAERSGDHSLTVVRFPANTLRQSAPGRYVAEFMPDQEGAYLVQVTGEQLSVTAGWVNPYSPEYRSLGGNLALLRQLASIGSGRLLNQPAEAFAHTMPAPRTARDIWPTLLTLAVLLLPLDVAARRLVFGRRDLLRARDALRDRLTHHVRKPVGESLPSVARLMGAKERVEAARPAAPVVSSAPQPSPAKTQASGVPIPPASDAQSTPGAVTDRLLQAKKRARRS